MTKFVVSTLGLFCKLYTSSGISKRELLNQGMWMYDVDRVHQTCLQTGVSIYTPASSVPELLYTYTELKFWLSDRWNMVPCYRLNLYLFRRLSLFMCLNINYKVYIISSLNCQEHQFFIVLSTDSGHLQAMVLSALKTFSKPCLLFGSFSQVEQKQQSQNAVGFEFRKENDSSLYHKICETFD